MKRFLALIAFGLLAACAPFVQRPAKPGPAFTGPRLEAGDFVSFDGARLATTTWDAEGGPPRAVVVGVHGMNDYANAFHLAAPQWAKLGITTIAYDQRGFGRSPGRGLWAGDVLMTGDLRTLTALVRSRYPHAIVAVVGESMGAAVSIEAFASDRPPDADRLVALAPAVWGWSDQPLAYKTALWLAAHLAGPKVFTPPSWVTDKIWPSDNHPELYAMGRDPLMLWGARSDTLYGLVNTMQKAWRDTGKLRGPALIARGAHDEVIPAQAVRQAVKHLQPGVRTAYYPDGWHLLMRDNHAARVDADVAAFIFDPTAPLPSDPAPIPGAPKPGL